METPLFVYRAQKRKISGSFDFTERNLHLPWVFFIPFVVMSAFIVLNIVVGIVVNSISEVTTELDSIRQRKKNEKQQITEQIEMMRSLLDSLERNVKDVKREK